MFDAKIDSIVAKFSDKVNATSDIFTDKLKMTADELSERFDELSSQMKVVIAVSLGLSVIDTILLFAILKKLG